MLKLENVSKIYYSKGIVATGITKVNLELNLGEFVVITGESGSGKSTLLNVISGVDSYEEGEMYVNGKETSHYTEKDFEEYRRKYIANIFQNFNLVNSYTVYQNIELILLLKGEKKHKIKKKILKIIDEVGLTKFRNTKVSKLSGGQKQRVAIARAIVKDTPIIVADEPTGNLDVKTAENIIELLRKVAKDKLVVLVTHNIEQVEKYATKIIKMHDGRIVGYNELKKVEEVKEQKESKPGQITAINKIRLGVRNTFNIFSKFILLYMVFTFMGIALLLQYASVQLKAQEREKWHLSTAFSECVDNRILIKKQDKTEFTKEDYEKIRKIPNVDYVVEDDIFTETIFSIKRPKVFATVRIQDINKFKEDVDFGRKPKRKNEAVLTLSADYKRFLNRKDEILGKKFSIINEYNKETIKDITVVGFKYYDEFFGNKNVIYVDDSVIKELRPLVNERYSELKILFNNKYVKNNIIPNDNVKKGRIIVNDDLKHQFKNNDIIGKPVEISVDNIYYNRKTNLKVEDTFTKDDFTKITGLKGYEQYKDVFFISKEDYKKLYNSLPYQSSVYVKNVGQIEKTREELAKLGIHTKKVTDYISRDDMAELKKETQAIRTVVTIVVALVLNFVAYFVIRLILKSRKIYYVILRMLGANVKNVNRILNIELFINASLSYLSVMLLIYLVKTNIINMEMMSELLSCLSMREYILMYVILIIIVKISSGKFSKKMFKDTTINIYNEGM